MSLPHEVDLRSASSTDRASTFVRAFDGLNPGELLVFLSDQDFHPLLHLLQCARPDLFDWAPLEAGPQEYSVEIQRRQEGARHGVEEFLRWEHRRLDALLAEVEWRLEQRMFRNAAQRFGYFRGRLLHHLDREERFVLPAFEEHAEAAGYPTRELRTEHAVMRRLVQQITLSLVSGEGSAARAMADIGVLREILGPHATKEGQTIFPVIDRVLPLDGDVLVQRMQEV